MKYFYLILILGIFSCTTQKETVSIFTKSKTNSISIKSPGLTYTSVDLDSAAIAQIVLNSPETLELKFPVGNGITVSLKRQNPFSSDFSVVSGNDKVDYKSKSLFYIGKVVGDETSIVSITIGDEITGYISGKDIEINIGKESDVKTSSYLLFDPNTSKDTIKFTCSELVAPVEIKPKDTSVHIMQTSGPRCTEIDFELTHEVFLKYGSIQAATNWFIGLFAGVQAIYKNEGIDAKIKSIYVWQTPDGYSKEAGVALREFQNRRKSDPTFTGDLAQLVRGRDGGGMSGIAYVDILGNRNYRFSYVEPLWSWAAYPNYSWSIEVIAHELGHNSGCPHTHSCSWELSPGVFGAIDACYTPEGGCQAAVPCHLCGTIMSYCHLNSAVGIKFSNGFGPIPGDRLRSRYNQCPCTVCETVSPPVPPSGQIILTKGKPATSSTTFYGRYPGSLAVDGNKTNFTHSMKETNPWIQIDLQGSILVSKVDVYNRQGCQNCGVRGNRMRIFISETPETAWDGPYKAEYPNDITNGLVLSFPINTKGRYITVMTQNNTPNYLNIAEIEGFGVGSPCKDTTIVVMRPKDTIVYRPKDTIVMSPKDTVICK